MKSRKHSRNASRKGSIRVSVSFPADIYKTLNDIARQKKVSLAWVVREAAEEYIAHKWPLFAKKEL
ncbi:MAG TPA: CopG family transcriptional regulator [Pyrinomonadaceae bacterium]|nr:CopG family transcriptional regulator [Pyrinomonadaceae bacterium]